MQALIVVALVVGFGAAVLVLASRAARRRRRRRFKCHDCEHLRRMFDDGVMCGYGTREVFKTRAHISMCPDWSPARRRR